MADILTLITKMLSVRLNENNTVWININNYAPFLDNKICKELLDV